MPGSNFTPADQVMLIFGLNPATSSDEVRVLLAGCHGVIRRLCQDLEVEVVVAPGEHQDAYALVHLWPDPLVAHRLAHDLNTRRLRAGPGPHGERGRSLRAWVPSMRWS
jgi:hypothetical protein